MEWLLNENDLVPFKWEIMSLNRWHGYVLNIFVESRICLQQCPLSFQTSDLCPIYSPLQMARGRCESSQWWVKIAHVAMTTVLVVWYCACTLYDDDPHLLVSWPWSCLNCSSLFNTKYLWWYFSFMIVRRFQKSILATCISESSHKTKSPILLHP